MSERYSLFVTETPNGLYEGTCYEYPELKAFGVTRAEAYERILYLAAIAARQDRQRDPSVAD